MSDTHKADLKAGLTVSFNHLGERIVSIGTMRLHFEAGLERDFGFLERKLVRSVNPCSPFSRTKLRQHLKDLPDGTIGLYSSTPSGGLVEEPTSYLHSAALLNILREAVDIVPVPPGFHDLQRRAFVLTVAAYEQTPDDSALLAQARLRPVRRHELF
jgi:hypothetical protein